MYFSNSHSVLWLNGSVCGTTKIQSLSINHIYCYKFARIKINLKPLPKNTKTKM